MIHPFYRLKIELCIACGYFVHTLNKEGRGFPVSPVCSGHCTSDMCAEVGFGSYERLHGLFQAL